MAITPTLGRIVWYTPESSEGVACDGDGRCAAIVTRVWSDGKVNLTVFDANGHTHPRATVTLVQPESERPEGRFCEWMPYQIQQADKAALAGR